MNNKLIDLTGQEFGDLKVLYIDKERMERNKKEGKQAITYWMCQCKCGNMKSFTSQSLRKGISHSCGCNNLTKSSKGFYKSVKDFKGENLIGKKFGNLTVLDFDLEKTNESIKKSMEGLTKRFKTYWKCICDCGNKYSVPTDLLRKGVTTSCGCKTKEKLKKASEKRERKYNKYDLSGKYGIGWTSNTNEEFYFDLEDYDKIKDYCWYESKRGYIESHYFGKGIKMHRLIMGVLNNSNNSNQIDHINRNRFDNRKNNLRICTIYENTYNKETRNKNGISGVDKNPDGTWKARIWKDKKIYFLGNYNTKEDAIKARLEGEAKYFGEFSPNINLFKKYGIVLDK